MKNLVGDTNMYYTGEHEFLGIATDLGFKEVLNTKYPSRFHPGTDETRYVLWHPDGALLTMYTFDGHCDGADLSVNWIPNQACLGNKVWIEEDGYSYWNFPALNEVMSQRSGHAIAFRDAQGYDTGNNIYISHYDVRGGLRRRFELLSQHGTLLSPWVEAPHVWFLTSEDEAELQEQCPVYMERFRHQKLVNLNYWYQLPKDVQAATQQYETKINGLF